MSAGAGAVAASFALVGMNGSAGLARPLGDSACRCWRCSTDPFAGSPIRQSCGMARLPTVMTLGGALVLVTSVAARAEPPCVTPPARVFVVRHAEKAKRPPGNPPLSAQGRERARALLRVLSGIEIDAIYATQYRRTQMTVQPLARALGLTIRVVKSGQTRRLARLLRCNHANQTVVVCGHSFTLPALLRRLGVDEKIHVRDSAYGDLYVLTYDSAGQPTLEMKRFDP